MKHSLPKRLVLATHNAGKLREFSDLLGPLIKEITSSGELGLPEPEETGMTFAENAILKAKAAALATGELSLSDDSGLCVTALGGKPGIYSARWAETPKGKNFPAAMERIQNELGDNKDRSATFICVLALYWPDGQFECIEGCIDGSLARTPRGSHGHGYDPLFIPKGETRTFAEMPELQKNAISHRGKAARALIERFAQTIK